MQEVKGGAFTDILGVCVISGCSVWIRCDHSIPACTDRLFRNDCIGSELVATHLDHVSGGDDSFPLLRCCDDSTLSVSGKTTLISETTSDAYHTWSDAAQYPLRDVTVRCLIVGWRQNRDTLEVHAVDMCMVTIVLRYHCPQELVTDGSLYPWLVTGSMIVIKYCLIQEYDRKYDILVLTRLEHTAIFRDTTGVADDLRKHCGDIDVNRLCENEKCRYDAIQNGKTMYQKCDVHGATTLECCTRMRVYGAAVDILPSANHTNHMTRCLVNKKFVLLVPTALMSLLFPRAYPEGAGLRCDILMTSEHQADTSRFVTLWIRNI